MKSKLILFGILIICVLIGAWFIVALINYNKDVRTLGKLVAEVKIANAKVASNDIIHDTVKFTDLLTYSYLYERNRSGVARIRENFYDAKGTSFWLLKKRQSKIAMVDSLFKIHDRWVANSNQVIQNLNEVNKSIVNLIQENNKGRSTANNIFKKDSDNKDYLTQSNEIQRLAYSTADMKLEVQKLQESNPIQDIADVIRMSVLKHFELMISKEISFLTNRYDCLVKVNSTLCNYKSSIYNSVSSSYGTIATLNSVTGTLQPIVSLINYKVEPVRELLNEMEKPIPGAGIGNLFGSSSKSTIDIIKSIDPVTGTTIESINKAIKELDNLENEIKQIISTTQPFLSSSDNFKSNGTRSDMLKLVESGPSLNKYLLSKKSLFNPMVNELDKVKSGIYELKSVVNNNMVPQKAKSYLYQLISYSTEIVNVCYYPFNSWEGVIDKTANPIGELATMEESYMRLVNDLAKDGAPVEISSSPIFTLSGNQTTLISPRDLPPESVPNSSISSEIKSSVKSTLESYYDLLDDEKLDEIYAYYTDPMKKWFTSRNISANDVITQAKQYYSRWAFHSTEINWSTLNILPIRNGYYKINYLMDYWVKQNENDSYRYYSLNIDIVMTPDYKINEMDEVILDRKIVTSVGIK